MATAIAFIGYQFPTSNREQEDSDASNDFSPNGAIRWDVTKDYSVNIQQFPLEVQLKSYLDQLIALSYYISFCGKGCNLLIDSYLNETITNFKYGFLKKFQLEMKTTDAYNKVIEETNKLVYQIEHGLLKLEIDIECLQDFRQVIDSTFGIKDIPCIEGIGEHSATWVTPYLIWLNYYWIGHSKLSECTSTNEYGIPRFRFYSCRNWKPGDDPLTAGPHKFALGIATYSMSHSFCADNFCPAIKSIRIYDFLVRFNHTGRRAETILADIGEQCLSIDVRRPTVSVSQKVAAAIRANVLGVITYAGVDEDIRQSLWSYHDFGVPRIDGVYTATINFLEFLRNKYGVTIEDKAVVQRLFYGFAETKEQRETVDYLRKQGGSASADKLGSSCEVMSGLEALQFVSQKNNALIVDGHDQGTSPKAAAEGEQTEKKESESKGEDSKSDDSGKDDQDSSKKENDSSNKDDEDAKQDDTVEGDEDESEDDNQGEGENENDATSGDDASSSGVSDMPPEDVQPNTSDVKGFKFKVANPEAETTDSVMFREEMDHFLANILANPPKSLSPQSVETLTCLHKFWLHTLSIGSIVGIVGSCLKHLPESLTLLTTKCTE